MNKELRKIIASLREQGFTVTRTKGSHYLVTKNGKRVATLAGSASDHRSMKNALAAVRRFLREEEESADQ